MPHAPLSLLFLLPLSCGIPTEVPPGAVDYGPTYAVTPDSPDYAVELPALGYVDTVGPQLYAASVDADMDQAETPNQLALVGTELHEANEQIDDLILQLSEEDPEAYARVVRRHPVLKRAVESASARRKKPREEETL